MDILGLDQYHTPRICKECGGIMIFKGVGEYQCEDCKARDYDDYGKVRAFLEEHKGANAAEVEAATGVKQKTIRLMLKESRLEVTENSKAFMNCERCGKIIRSGRLCPKCETEYHRILEEEQRKKRNLNVSGHGMQTESLEKGEKRFNRE